MYTQIKSSIPLSLAVLLLISGCDAVVKLQQQRSDDAPQQQANSGQQQSSLQSSYNNHQASGSSVPNSASESSPSSYLSQASSAGGQQSQGPSAASNSVSNSQHGYSGYGSMANNQNSNQKSSYVDNIASASNNEQSYNAAASSVNLALANSGIFGSQSSQNSNPPQPLNPLHYFYYPPKDSGSLSQPKQASSSVSNSGSGSSNQAPQVDQMSAVSSNNYNIRFPSNIDAGMNGGLDVSASNQDPSYMSQPVADYNQGQSGQMFNGASQWGSGGSYLNSQVQGASSPDMYSNSMMPQVSNQQPSGPNPHDSYAAATSTYNSAISPPNSGSQGSAVNSPSVYLPNLQQSNQQPQQQAGPNSLFPSASAASQSVSPMNLFSNPPQPSQQQASSSLFTNPQYLNSLFNNPSQFGQFGQMPSMSEPSMSVAPSNAVPTSVGGSGGSKRFGISSFIMPMLALAGLSLLIPTMSNLGPVVGRKKRSVDDKASSGSRQQQISFDSFNGASQLAKEMSIGEYMDKIEKYYSIYKNAVESDSCMNRLICEFGDAVKDITGKSAVITVIEKLVPNWMTGKVHLFKEAAIGGRSGKEECKKYICNSDKY